jgi:hypothetical protein
VTIRQSTRAPASLRRLIELRERAAVVVLSELIADPLHSLHWVAHHSGNVLEAGQFGGGHATEPGDELETSVLPSFHEDGRENSVLSDRFRQRLDISEFLAHVAVPTNVAERNDGHLRGCCWRRRPGAFSGVTLLLHRWILGSAETPKLHAF